MPKDQTTSMYDWKPCASDDSLHEPGPGGSWKVCHVVRQESMGDGRVHEWAPSFVCPLDQGVAPIGCVR